MDYVLMDYVYGLGYAALAQVFTQIFIPIF